GAAWYELRDRSQQVEFEGERERRQAREDRLSKDLAEREYVRKFRQAWQEWSRNAPYRALDFLASLKHSGKDDPRGFEWYFLFDRAKRAPKHLGPAGASVYAMALAPNAKLLAMGHDGGEISLWDPITWKKKGTLTSNVDSVYHLAFSPDSKLLAASGDGKGEKHYLKLYD